MLTIFSTSLLQKCTPEQLMGVAEFHIPDMTPVLSYTTTSYTKHTQILFEKVEAALCLAAAKQNEHLRLFTGFARLCFT